MNAKTETQNSDPIASAMETIRVLAAEAQKANDAYIALEQKTHVADEVQIRLNELNTVERDAMAAWAASGAQGHAPTPDRSKRQKLEAELAEANATANAARGALEGADAKSKEVQGRLHEAQRSLNALKLRQLSLQADKYGAAYRKHLIEAERNRQYLIALERFLGGRQNLDDHRTLGHLRRVQEQIHLRDIAMDRIANDMHREAQAHWLQMFQQLGAGRAEEG